jgi:hypothetical protein
VSIARRLKHRESPARRIVHRKSRWLRACILSAPGLQHTGPAGDFREWEVRDESERDFAAAALAVPPLLQSGAAARSTNYALLYSLNRSADRAPHPGCCPVRGQEHSLTKRPKRSVTIRECPSLSSSWPSASPRSNSTPCRSMHSKSTSRHRPSGRKSVQIRRSARELGSPLLRGLDLPDRRVSQ